jgi:hypothetical protein
LEVWKEMAPTLYDVKMRVPAGSVIEYRDYHSSGTVTVAMPGPVASSVWATRDDTGEWVCLKWSGRRKRFETVLEETARAAAQRRAVVIGYVESLNRYWGRSIAQWAFDTWTAWHTLYPGVPFDPEIFADRHKSHAPWAADLFAKPRMAA